MPDSKDTVQFMVELHRQLLTGLSPSAALAAATSAAVREGVPYSVWGSYAVYASTLANVSNKLPEVDAIRVAVDDKVVTSLKCVLRLEINGLSTQSIDP